MHFVAWCPKMAQLVFVSDTQNIKSKPGMPGITLIWVLLSMTAHQFSGDQ
jgi:hypothetical protein